MLTFFVREFFIKLVNDIPQIHPSVKGHWQVYMIENKLGQYYTGICTDLDRRFKEHQASGPKCAKALKGKGPLSLIFSCIVADHSCALKTEIWIKKLTKANKVKLVRNQLANSPIQNMQVTQESS